MRDEAQTVNPDEGERRRWLVAHRLDELPGMCWANLVTWALGRGPRLRDCRVDWVCRDDVERNGSCYCNKLQREAKG